MRHVEPFLSTARKSRDQLIKLADKYQLDTLMERALSEFKYKGDFYTRRRSQRNPDAQLFDTLSDETNIRLFHRVLEMDFKIEPTFDDSETPAFYKKSLAKTDKTDAILVVQGRKLHVNKAVLSYHSDYFDTLFNSNFKEKSMKEIPIKDVNFEEFATLLSFFHQKPIGVTKENAENILELADRFCIPSAKLYVEFSLISSSSLDFFEKMQFGETHGLNNLFNHALNSLNGEHFAELTSNDNYQKMSPSTKKKLFYRYLKI